MAGFNYPAQLGCKLEGQMIMRTNFSFGELHYVRFKHMGDAADGFDSCNPFWLEPM